MRAQLAIVMVDGYHGFLALPVRFDALEERIFYVGGRLQVRAGGQGACFLHVPAGCTLRPRDTGWFASFGRLTGSDGRPGRVPGRRLRFWGATFDPARPLSPGRGARLARRPGPRGRGHPQPRAARCSGSSSTARRLDLPALRAEALITPRDLARQGHFLTFRVPDAAAMASRLEALGVDVDTRGDRLRFGFGLYHEAGDIDRLAERLRKLPAGARGQTRHTSVVRATGPAAS